MKPQTFYWLKYLIARCFPTQPVYLLQYGRYRETAQYNIVLGIGLFGIHFTYCDLDSTNKERSDFIHNTMNIVWKGLYNAAPTTIYNADDILLHLVKKLRETNGVDILLISSPKIINNTKLV